VLLDLGLPSIDGLEICAQLREASNAAIMVISARDSVLQRVGGLDAGADDYLVKPFSLQELHARVRAPCAARGCSMPRAGCGSATWCSTPPHGRSRAASSRSSSRDASSISSNTSVRNRGQVLERTRILEAVWGSDFLGGSCHRRVRGLRATEAGGAWGTGSHRHDPGGGYAVR